MRNLAAILGVLVIAAGIMIEQQDNPSLEQRVAALESWRLKVEASLQGPKASSPTSKDEIPSAPAKPSDLIIVVKVENKRFDPSRTGSDPSEWKLEDNIWWDTEYTASGLKKPARSVKGILRFCDLFGEPKFSVRVTLNEPLEPGGKASETGVGIKYNQFTDSHKWLRATELKDMVIQFNVEAILYKDGTTETFAQ